MEIRFEERKQLSVVGCRIPDPAAASLSMVDCAAGWYGKDFSQVDREDYAKAAAADKGEIGIWLHDELNPDDLAYFYGPVVDDFSYIPAGMSSLEIPAAHYAIFRVDVAARGLSLEAYRDTIRQAWKYIFQEWFEQNKCSYDESKYTFEHYCQELVEIYVPIK